MQLDHSPHLELLEGQVRDGLGIATTVVEVGVVWEHVGLSVAVVDAVRRRVDTLHLVEDNTLVCHLLLYSQKQSWLLGHLAACMQMQSRHVQALSVDCPSQSSNAALQCKPPGHMTSNSVCKRAVPERCRQP